MEASAKHPRFGDAPSSTAELLPDRVTSLAEFSVERVLNDGGEGGSLNGAHGALGVACERALTPARSAGQLRRRSRAGQGDAAAAADGRRASAAA